MTVRDNFIEQGIYSFFFVKTYNFGDTLHAFTQNC